MAEAYLKKVVSIINCMETGTPNMKYDEITLLPDGPNGVKMVTLGVGFTEFGSNLKKVVDRYILKKGKYAINFKPYLNRIGKMPSLCSDKNFISVLKNSSLYDQKMRDAQDEIFEEEYLGPGLKWALHEGFNSPLSILCVIDSYLQSGSIFTFLRNRFSEVTPLRGGDEKKWITSYITERNKWLSNHSNKAVRSSSYRTKTYLQLINKGNWNLEGPIRTLHGCNVV